MSQYYKDSIFWIEVEKISPNPYQPRKEFDQLQLKSLSDSIRQYGVLQALVVTRKDVEKPDGGMSVEYELIAGERRLRASKLAGLTQVPCLIQTGLEDNNQLKLELAIIENLQREDLNPVDRAKSFKQLADEFSMTHVKIAEKVGKSREYVSNTLRLLQLSDEILQAVSDGKITEGHARPLLMLKDKLDEQNTLFKEIMYKRLTVRETEQISRKVAHNKTRKKDVGNDPVIMAMEEKFSESLGTRVHIEKKKTGGKILIDFFSDEDLRTILEMLKDEQKKSKDTMMQRYIDSGASIEKPVVVDKSMSVQDAIEQTTGVVFENEVKPGYYQHEAPNSAPVAHTHDVLDEEMPLETVAPLTASNDVPTTPVPQVVPEVAAETPAVNTHVSMPMYTDSSPVAQSVASAEPVIEEPSLGVEVKEDDEDIFTMDSFSV